MIQGYTVNCFYVFSERRIKMPENAAKKEQPCNAIKFELILIYSAKSLEE